MGITRLVIISAIIASLGAPSFSYAANGAESSSGDQVAQEPVKAVEAQTEEEYNEEYFFDYNYNEESVEEGSTLKEILADPVEILGPNPLRLTLEECIRMAMEHNAKLQATGYAIDAAKAQLKEATAHGWPVLEYEYRTAPVPNDVSDAMNSFFSGDITWFNKLKVGVGIPLYSFGKISLVKELAQIGVDVSRVQAFQEKNSLASKVKQLYYGILLAEEMGRLLREAHQQLTRELEKREGEKGDVEYSPLDNLKMRVYQYELERRLAETRQKHILVLEGLRAQMGLAEGTVFTVFSNKLRPVETSLKKFDDYLAVAKENRPEEKLLNSALEARKNQFRLEKRKLFPDIGIGAFFEIGHTLNSISGLVATDDFSDPFNFTRAGFGLQVSGKIDFHGSSARIKKAKSEYYKLNLEQMIAREGLKLDVRSSYLDVKTAAANLRRAERAQKTARKLLFLTKSNREIGIGEQKDYVDALQMVLMTRGRYFESVFDYNSALAKLDEKVGVLPEVAQ